MKALRKAFHSLTFYPVTALYLVAVLVVYGVANHALRFDIGLVMLTLLAVAIFMVGLYWELHVVHSLVNSQHDELIQRGEDLKARIVLLTAALIAGGVEVPGEQGVGSDSPTVAPMSST
jgi:hypothetical protein